MDSWRTGLETEYAMDGLASADLMYLARVRPVVPDAFVVQRLKDVQRIKAQELDVVLLQFWLAGLTGLAESSAENQRNIWKSMVLVKMPSIASKLHSDQEQVCGAVELALRQLSFYRGLLSECDENVAEENPAYEVDMLKAIAMGCYAAGVVRPNRLDILNGISPTHNILSEFQIIGQSSLDLIDGLCGRTLIDYENQEKLVNRIIQLCEDASSRNDVVVLSKLCQTLDDNPLVLDIILLLKSPSALLFPLESFVNNLQQNEEDDIDTCNSNLEGFGIVLILTMTIIRRYEFSGCLDSILKDKNGFCYLWLHRTSATIPATTSKPQMLLEISPSIFEQSLAACQAGVLDSTTLNSGLDYFLQPCLLFVLIGVVQYLCEEILFSSTSFASAAPSSGLPVSASGQPMLSPAGYVVSPLASRGGKHSQYTHPTPSSGVHNQVLGKSVASVAMLQTSLKSLLAGEAFPLRLMRLLKNEITAALQHQTMENDHQMAVIQERLTEASFNYYSWSASDTYDVSKLAQQTSQAFEAIVSGGRASLVSKREKSWPVFGGSCYHIDVDLFRSTLCFLGPSQFVTTILKQLLKAALTSNGWRAVELGAAVMTTPLIGRGDQYLAPQSLLWTLIYRTLWIPVPGKLETFAQGKLLAAFIGMTLDFFQSNSLIQLREKQFREGHSYSQTMDIDSANQVSSQMKSRGNTGNLSSIAQLERDAAVESFRVTLDQRLKALEPIARDRPGFEGFVQGLEQYRKRHPPLSLPLQRPKGARQG
ncbi:mediator complex subunit [Mortierella sp. AD010]|nr:mediator complex subunit [Mortierella sp. AD010]